MNRETKFGLITGLLLIVAIGMLISRYLSSRATPAIQTPALRSLGGNFRRQIISPAGTAVIPTALQASSSGQSSTTAPSALAEGLPTASQFHAGAAFSATQPSVVVGTMGHASASVPATGTPAAEVSDIRTPIPSVKPKTSTQYTVKVGDTLWHIAHKFYHQVGPSQLARIVRANPGKLSSTKSMLQIGETLVIPVTSASGQIHLTQMAAISVGSVPVPTTTHNLSSPPTAHPKATSTRIVTYKIRPGDTLYSIARRIFGASSHAAITQIMRENHIHSARDLRVGRILHIDRVRP
ncbi:MAG: LysM peptidoglycan-binding domain-containing protein [Phycisphaerae bacterium]|nr:LysM peptidoglycan-binding domain-containing protein [Phycisphaerae bacterium]